MTHRFPYRIVLALIGLFVLVMVWGLGVRLVLWHRVSQHTKHLQTQVEAIDNSIAQDTAHASEDTEGGTTPQETISLYIKALRAGDFEQASQYFVIGKQAGVLESLRAMSPEALENAIRLSSEAASSSGEFGANRESFTIRDPLLFHLIRNSNGTWKVVEW